MTIGRLLYRAAIGAAVSALIAAMLLWQVTSAALQPVPQSFDRAAATAYRIQVTDRHGTALNTTYANDWNLHATAAIHEIQIGRASCRERVFITV